MLANQLFDVRDFPAVVQAAEVAALRTCNDDAALHDFVSGYLGFDERARYALQTLLDSLASGRGGAFFLNGVFGSGKSHLLGLMALLCQGKGHTAFCETHPAFSPQLDALPLHFVVHFSLDDYDASQFSLEAAVRREIEKEWHLRFGQVPQWSRDGTRSEYFLEIGESLKAHGHRACFLGIDELSLFLSAKEHRALQADAAFLQFLGQRAARSTPCSMHIVAALQKNMDDIGNLEAYSLSQIRDRFCTLALSLAHIPSLIERRLIAHTHEASLQRACAESYDALLTALPHIDFGRTEWQQLYPFHPATIALLEQVVSRFFSRTRSAALFCVTAAREHWGSGSGSNARILPDALFDYLLPELETHPEMRALEGVWRSWRESVPDLARDVRDGETMQRLMKTLLLFKLAGSAPTVIQLAHAANVDADLHDERNYEYARLLLERLRVQGSFLVCERREGPWQDRYAVDLGTRVSELARRHLRSALLELDSHDARISDHVVCSCHEDSLPLAALNETSIFAVPWCHAPRQVAVQLWQRETAIAPLANRAAALGQVGSDEELLLLIVPPFATRTTTLPIHAWPVEPRWKNGVVLWTPRPPTDDEVECAREAVATRLLESDPQLLDNRRGRSILSYFAEGAAARERQLAQIALRLLREGQLITASGMCIEAAELALGTSWMNTLEAIAEFAFPRIYPRFSAIAPRLRVLTASNVQSLGLEVLRRPASDSYYAITHERLVRALAEPLGLAVADKGRWRIASLRTDLAREIIEAVGETSTLAALANHFACSDWGLTREQFELALCGLLRSGELCARDARGQELPPAQMGLPLSRALRSLYPGQLLEPVRWAQLQAVFSCLEIDDLNARTFAEQAAARQQLAQWCSETTQQLELAKARLHQLQRALCFASWPRSERTLEMMINLLENLRDDAQVLARAAALDRADLGLLIQAWQELRQQLEARQSTLLSAHALLNHADLNSPPEIRDARDELLLRLQQGEEVLADESFPEAWQQWREEYSGAYRSWHQQQHEAARWLALRRLHNSEALRFLDRLSALRSREFPQADAIRHALQHEIDKLCTRDGVLLPVAASCNICHLRYGQRLTLRPTHEIELEIEAALRHFAQRVHEPAAKEYLQRHELAQELLAWGGATEELPTLSDEVLVLIDAAFAPRRVVRRSLSALAEQLQQQRTRAQLHDSFLAWLDAGEALSPEDEVVLQDMPDSN